MAIDSATSDVRFELLALEDSSCWRLARILGTMFRSPSYQRQGSIWTARRKQVFIDSLLNGFDIPKIYLHEGGDERPGKRYAIVDGKQRLEALAAFYSGGLRLAADFKLFNTDRITEAELDAGTLAQLAGKNYVELESLAPALIKYLDQRKLDVRVIRTNDLDVIEELFWRLNEAATLNGPEHRRGIGGPAVSAVDELVKDPFFACLPFGDRRFRHQDLATKFLLWSSSAYVRSSAGARGAIADTKKQNLDRYFTVLRGAQSSHESRVTDDLADATAHVRRVLAALTDIYVAKDPLLARIGTVAVVFLQASRALRNASGFAGPVGREVLEEFEEFRERTLEGIDEDGDLSLGVLALMDYGALAQSSNDGSALERRVKIFEAYASAIELRTAPLEALGSV